jgi:hypothetical protein
MTMRTHLVATTLLVVLAFGFPHPLTAQEEKPEPRPAPKMFASRGTTELGGTASFTYTTNVTNGVTAPNSMSIFSFAPYAGYFIMDGLELGVNPLGVSITSFAGTSVTTYFMFFAPSYNFKLQSSAFPFVEGLAGYTARTNGGTVGGFSYGGRAGVKIAVTERGLLTLAGQYLLVTLNPSGADKRNGYNQLLFSAGFGVWL